MHLFLTQNGRIISVCSGKVEDALSKYFPDREGITDYYFEQDDKEVLENFYKYQIVNGNYVLKSDEKVKQIQESYQVIFNDLAMQKLHAEMVGEPFGLIIAEYRKKRGEMNEAIRVITNNL